MIDLVYKASTFIIVQPLVNFGQYWDWTGGLVYSRQVLFYFAATSTG